jgi:hypothetical protein
MIVKFSIALAIYALLALPSVLDAQSWSGEIGNVDVQIARREGAGSKVFRVYVDKAKAELKCIRVDTGAGHLVEFCSDDLDKYSSPEIGAIKLASEINLLFSFESVDYWCEAPTPDSDLLCKVRLSGTSKPFPKQTNTLPNQSK